MSGFPRMPVAEIRVVCVYPIIEVHFFYCACYFTFHRQDGHEGFLGNELKSLLRIEVPKQIPE